MLFLLALLPTVLAAFNFGWIDDFAAQPGSEVTAVQRLAPRDGLKGLSDFQPIHNTITQSEYQYYSFTVNTSTGIGEYYEYLVFITGNICLQPSDLSASGNDSLTVYYSFNSLMFSDMEISTMVHFENGYFQALGEVDTAAAELTLYIAVYAPQSTNTTAEWLYEIGVSQNDLVFQWDNHPFAEVVDTDNQAALIVTSNLTNADMSQLNLLDSLYQLYVYTEEYKDYFATLNSSWCAVRSGPALRLASDIASSYTYRGGSLREQFYIDGLNASTTYVAYLVLDFSGSSYGGAVYKQFEFETLSTEACTLLYDLDFCNEVAYSVPASSLISNLTELGQLYDGRAEDLFTNFSKALQQIPCNTTDDAVFSPVRSCSDCNSSYRYWLCAVTIPRCTTHNISGYLHRDANESRNTWIDDYVVPPLDYFEVLPCVNVCQTIVRDCPADFGFSCPKDNASIKLSYYWDTYNQVYASCNFVGIQALSDSMGYVLRAAWWMFVPAVATTMMMV